MLCDLNEKQIVAVVILDKPWFNEEVFSMARNENWLVAIPAIILVRSQPHLVNWRYKRNRMDHTPNESSFVRHRPRMMLRPEDNY